MHKIHCETCKVGVYSDLKVKEWKCSPCVKGLSVENLICIACGLKNGVFIETLDSKWIHLMCGLLLKPYVKSINQINLARHGLNCVVNVDIPPDLYNNLCVYCKQRGQSVGFNCISCGNCMHIGCVIHKNWKIIGENFECGCTERKKNTKKNKNHNLPPIRGPKSCLVLEHIMEKIIKSDTLMIFRQKSNTPDTYKQEILSSLSSDCYIDSSAPDSIAVIISKSKNAPYKKLKLTPPSEILSFAEIFDVIDESEPKYVEDYKSYESSKLLNLDHIYNYYIRGHAYFSISQVLKDLRHMILNKLQSTPYKQEKIYINQFWDLALLHLTQNAKIFQDAVLSDWKAAIENNQNAARVATPWQKKPFKSRNYEMIQDYLEVSQGTKDRLKTQKKGKCDGLVCNNLNELGPFDLINSTWKSNNPDRSVRVECTDQCMCDVDRCKNRQISLKQFQKLNEDVKEVDTWGFDVYTYRNILAYMRHPVIPKMHKFISKTLTKAINSVKSDNWNILNGLNYIIEDTQNIFTLRDKRYADGLRNAVMGLAEIIGQDLVLNQFQIHPKGTGVVCSNLKGIPQNSLIVEYFGQLYSPSKWYEKQDTIKSLMNQIKKKQGINETLPDFYNIMLERHMDDPEGYDVLIVDPIFYGSYGSRLSHSCTPNCGTVTMIAEGRYSIGMYALTDIKYLDELTFDYNSITESKDEHLNAVCLCASSICRSFYLAHALNSSNIPSFHNFLHRISLILKACCSKITDEDLQICEKFCIRSAVLQNCPDWLKIWIASVLKVIEKEVSGISIEIYKKNIIDSRLQNLVMTVDKIKYCMDRSSNHEPYRLLRPDEIQEYLWGTSDVCVRQQLKKLLTDLGLSTSLTDQEFSSFVDIRRQLLRIRDLLKSSYPNTWKGAGIADVIHLIANTQVFFVEVTYKSFESDSVPIRYCEISKSNTKSGIFRSLSKKYSSLHIQGTLCGWYKQTVEKPAASLSADKRGTLNVSCIECPAEANYSEKLRKILLSHLKEKPWSSWPTKLSVKYPWGNFTNRSRVLGTPMFDAYYLENNEILSQALTSIDIPADNCDIVNTYLIDNM